jgi:hypothetical protein
MKKGKKFGIAAFGIFVLVATLWAVDVSSLFGDKTIEQIEFIEVDDTLQFVSGTEYFPGQEGQVAVMIVDSSGSTVTADYNCSYDVLYPDKTTFVSGNFSALSSLATYYTNFTVPDVDGVYEYGAECVKGGKTAVAGKSFHVTQKRIRAVHVQ